MNVTYALANITTNFTFNLEIPSNLLFNYIKPTILDAFFNALAVLILSIIFVKITETSWPTPDLNLYHFGFREGIIYLGNILIEKRIIVCTVLISFLAFYIYGYIWEYNSLVDTGKYCECGVKYFGSLVHISNAYKQPLQILNATNFSLCDQLCK